MEWAHKLRVLDLKLGMEKARVKEKMEILSTKARRKGITAPIVLSIPSLVEELEVQLSAHLELIKFNEK